MKIKAPNEQYNGVSAGVTFVKGVGETENPYLIEWFTDHGYTVEEENSLATENPEGEEKPKKKGAKEGGE